MAYQTIHSDVPALLSLTKLKRKFQLLDRSLIRYFSNYNYTRSSSSFARTSLLSFATAVLIAFFFTHKSKGSSQSRAATPPLLSQACGDQSLFNRLIHLQPFPFTDRGEMHFAFRDRAYHILSSWMALDLANEPILNKKTRLGN